MVFVSDECKINFSKVKRGKELRYCIFKFINETDLVVDKIGSKKESNDESWEEFVSSLPSDECRYCVYQLPYVSKTDKVERSAFIFLRWCPSGASTKTKMISTFFQKEVISNLPGSYVQTKLQAGSLDGLEYDYILEQALRFVTVK
eukprot:TRINITY_DN620_c0_g1_i3.p1 TRINITY_DN620_c0_g1~~TRINITY_DN620_c0_g1_i3.p1  ORF type:complete len:146 (+),score=48.78 TRINITY_DN620_c0_g1_i3:57-494(+)